MPTALSSVAFANKADRRRQAMACPVGAVLPGVFMLSIAVLQSLSEDGDQRIAASVDNLNAWSTVNPYAIAHTVLALWRMGR
ncbi:MAG: hypothetical protein ACJ8G2_04760 [Burkholderiales bacterium]